MWNRAIFHKNVGYSFRQSYDPLQLPIMERTDQHKKFCLLKQIKTHLERDIGMRKL